MNDEKIFYGIIVGAVILFLFLCVCVLVQSSEITDQCTVKGVVIVKACGGGPRCIKADNIIEIK